MTVRAEFTAMVRRSHLINCWAGSCLVVINMGSCKLSLLLPRNVFSTTWYFPLIRSVGFTFAAELVQFLRFVYINVLPLSIPPEHAVCTVFLSLGKFQSLGREV